MIKILLINNIYPHYRKDIWDELNKSQDFEIDFIYGKSNNGVYDLNGCNRLLTNYHFRNVLFWQSGVLSIILKNNYNIFIFNGESNCLSTWIAAILIRIKNKKLIFWGHGMYGNEFLIKKIFRNIFNSLPHSHLLYSNYSKSLLSKYLDKNRIFVIKNSINYYQSLKYRNIKIERQYQKYNLLFIGRLVKNKRIHLLINALQKLESKKYILHIIGSGPELNKIKSHSIKLNVYDQIIFHGSCYDESLLSNLILNCDLLISPGNVGLNVIHCLEYGIPVCTHNNIKNQMPEFEAIIPFKNGILFNENDYCDLAFKINLWFSEYYDIVNYKFYCYDIIDKYYNPLYQSNIFKKAIEFTLAN